MNYGEMKGEMDRYIGTIMTVRNRHINGVGVKCKEDNGIWWWRDRCYEIVTDLLTKDNGESNLTPEILMDMFKNQKGE